MHLSTAGLSDGHESRPSGSAPRAKPIVVLEDDPGFRRVLVELLEGEGFDVSICATYAALLEAVRLLPSAIVVADFWGTSHRTLTAVERAQIQDLGRHAPTILLTGRAWAASETAEELNIACILGKPPALDELITHVFRCARAASESS
jgi:DNA-binding NtrC family response regulator